MHIDANSALAAAIAGDSDATAVALSALEDLIREYADSEEAQQIARVTLWSALPDFQGNGWEEFTAYARKVLEAR
ncbi:hypothetical protein [Streptomyces sp. NPDC006134]|uniref:hypothetical protein n=1 Tax=Streptomyces sp. NPDC006134 TaxID=3154467 RepID=UPI0033FB409A